MEVLRIKEFLPDNYDNNLYYSNYGDFIRNHEFFDEYLGDGTGNGLGSAFLDNYFRDYGFGSSIGSGYSDYTGNGCYYDYLPSFNKYCGIKSFNGKKVYIIDCVQTIIDNIHGNVAKGSVLNIDFTLTPCFVIKQDSIYAHGRTLYEAQAALRGKIFQKYPIETRISKFKEQYPKFNKKIPAKELYEWHGILTGSCEIGRESFINNMGIDIEKDSFTVQEFIELTKDSYRGDIIMKLKDSYE